MTQINLRQFARAFVPALALLLLWEVGKYVARHRMKTRSTTPAPQPCRPDDSPSTG